MNNTNFHKSMKTNEAQTKISEALLQILEILKIAKFSLGVPKSARDIEAGIVKYT